jgi:AcrR family transcriptional regulator
MTSAYGMTVLLLIERALIMTDEKAIGLAANMVYLPAMTVTQGTPRKRLAPEERRAEIVSTACRIGLEEGLERITLRRVAADLSVRPGLISHYFPEADKLVALAFAEAVEAEREQLFPESPTGSASERVVHFLDAVLSVDSVELSRLWLNARIVSRYNAALRQTLAEQEKANRERLIALIETGIEDGDFTCAQPGRSALLIFVLVDAMAGYANEDRTEVSPLVAELLFETTERELSVPAGALSSISQSLEETP